MPVPVRVPVVEGVRVPVGVCDGVPVRVPDLLGVRVDVGVCVPV